MPRPPASVTACAVSSTLPGRWEVAPAVRPERAVTHTVQPARPRATAMPRPTPRLAPVTQAVLWLTGTNAIKRRRWRIMEHHDSRFHRSQRESVRPRRRVVGPLLHRAVRIPRNLPDSADRAAHPHRGAARRPGPGTRLGEGRPRDARAGQGRRPVR